MLGKKMTHSKCKTIETGNEATMIFSKLKILTTAELDVTARITSNEFFVERDFLRMIFFVLLNDLNK